MLMCFVSWQIKDVSLSAIQEVLTELQNYLHQLQQETRQIKKDTNKKENICVKTKCATLVVIRLVKQMSLVCNSAVKSVKAFPCWYQAWLIECFWKKPMP